jgi:hypothetical protein
MSTVEIIEKKIEMPHLAEKNTLDEWSYILSDDDENADDTNLNSDSEEDEEHDENEGYSYDDYNAYVSDDDNTHDDEYHQYQRMLRSDSDVEYNQDSECDS